MTPSQLQNLFRPLIGVPQLGCLCHFRNRLARQRLIDRGVARNIALDKQTTQ